MDYMVNIFELLGNKSTINVLQYFLERPTGKSYLAQLAKEIKLSKGSIIKALENLRKAAFLREERIGKTILYSLDNSNSEVRELKKLLAISQALEALASFRNAEFEAYLYGSAARGDNDEKSDIDILIIADKKEKAGSLLSTIKSEKIKPMMLTRIDYAMLARKDAPLYERIEKDRIRLF
jgi:predicted nucleotidyltransferase